MSPPLEAVPPPPPPLRLWRITRSALSTPGRYAGKIVDDAELERLRGLKIGEFLRYEPARIHRCSACGKEDAWRDSWGWYGSIEEVDNWQGEQPVIPKWCSEACRQKLIADKIVPRNMRHLDDE